MIIVTGAAGFIGQYLIKELISRGYDDLVAVDDWTSAAKKERISALPQVARVDRKGFHQWLNENHRLVQIIFHLGARTDTTEFNEALLEELNTAYTRRLFEIAGERGLPVIYASSAATYGDGSLGYMDDHTLIPKLQPLNPYGLSKNELDKWLIYDFDNHPYYWAGLKFFNVYGPGEDHKGRMASVVWHAYEQIRRTGEMKLFRSHNPAYTDGGQMRDFVFVGDVVDVLIWLMNKRVPQNRAIYNLGSGHARTFLDLVQATFRAMGREPNISFIDTPEDIRDKYQYYTQADMRKLRAIGYDRPFTPLEEGVEKYVKEYLLPAYPLA